MAEIKVKSTELKNKAETLTQLNSKFRQEVQKMVQYESELATMWEGDAQQAFRQAFNTDRAKMDLFAKTIDTYIQALRTDAGIYEQAETRAYQTAKTRKS